MKNINLFGGVVNLSQDWLNGQQSALCEDTEAESKIPHVNTSPDSV